MYYIFTAVVFLIFLIVRLLYDIKSTSSFLRESFPSQLVAHIYIPGDILSGFQGFTREQDFAFFSKVGPLFVNTRIGMPADPGVYTHERVYSVRVYWPWGARTVLTQGNHLPFIYIPWPL